MKRIKELLNKKVQPASNIDNAIMFAIGLTIAFILIIK